MTDDKKVIATIEFTKADSDNNYYHWSVIYHFLIFLRMEGHIEDVTFRHVQESLLRLKYYIIPKIDDTN